MGNVTDMLLDTEASLESMVEASGKTIPKPGQRYSTVEHLDYIIDLLGTMVSKETYKAAKKKMANGFNAINDRVEIINYLLSSGEISGDVDIEPITITENGEYTPGAGHAFGRVTVSTPVVEDQSTKIIDGTLENLYNEEATAISDGNMYMFPNLKTVELPNVEYISYPSKIPLFMSCANLSYISMPKLSNLYSDIKIGNMSCLETLNLNSVEIIPSYMFADYSKLNSISFDNCISINPGAFTGCSNLTEISFPKCTTVGSAAFANCTRLAGAYIGSFASGGTVTINQDAFAGCGHLGSVQIHGIPYFSASAFAGCSNLNHVYIQGDINYPSTIGNIYPNTFVGCDNLQFIHVPSFLYSYYMETNAYWSLYRQYITSDWNI